jgi:hypothetical protein
MTWWEWFGVWTGAGGVVASILGAWHIDAIRGNGRLTRKMLERVTGSTQALIRGTHEDSQALIQTIHEGYPSPHLQKPGGYAGLHPRDASRDESGA